MLKNSESLNHEKTFSEDASNFFYCLFLTIFTTIIFTIFHSNALFQTDLARNYSWEIKTIPNINVNSYSVSRPRNHYKITLPINHLEKETFTCHGKLFIFCKNEYAQHTTVLKSVEYYHTQLKHAKNQVYRLKTIEYIDRNNQLSKINTLISHPNAQSEISKNSKKLWAILIGGTLLSLFFIYWISTLKFTPIQFRVFISLTIVIYYFFKLYKTAMIYF
ncbi:hypothetical protein BEN71_16410 [Acinetobacter wuhouensis]|uniref:Uncharacterized protein n=1 Tax=Acinetobacter wuhouensis TaxID=1879050 RepID=A0A385C7L3_9GAMM|nr:hypothetical protein [Acinetobacter wuhouensis]AXQ23554.1 hypothetical protein BEN71_16410 [Acinetobacter wuhouensis]RZG46263.1 hypothetical protein EXU28_09410 [Acinetobacter wuhouensis]